MSTLNALGCLGLLIALVCGFIAWRRGEWASVKHANEALNDSFGDVANLPGDFENLVHGGAK